MAQHSSTGPLVAAFAGNLAIAALKGVAALITGSGAMLAESIHSLADSTNQVLLYVGSRRARRRPDRRHPFGYGQEAYFWAFLVSIGIFAGGAVFSLYEGSVRLSGHAASSGSKTWAYAVLGTSILFEGLSLMVALRAFRRTSAGRRPMEAIREARDPVLVTVVLEDTAATAGLLIALGGIALADLTGNPIYDALATLLIGLVLAVVAWLLAREAHSLLLGEAASDELMLAIRQVLDDRPEIRSLTDLRTLQMGPESIYVMLEAQVDPRPHGGDVARAIDAVEADLLALSPHIRRVFLEPQTVEGAAREETRE